MNEIFIYKNTDKSLRAKIKALDSSEITKEKNTTDKITLDFELNTYIIFDLNDYIIYDFQLYYLKKIIKVDEIGGKYIYNLDFRGGISLFEETKFLLITDTAEKIYYDSIFTLTCTPLSFLSSIILNLNRTAGFQKYTQGIINKDVEGVVTTIDVSNWNILEALKLLSNKIGFDFYLDPINNILHFDTRQSAENNDIIKVSVGVNNGLRSINRLVADSDNVYTRVYGYGSSTNMPTRDIYIPSMLKVEKLDLGVIPYLEKNTEKYGVIETVIDFDDIYPSFKGEVKSILNDKKFYDSTISFDPNQHKINNENFQITFLSGLLNGITLDVIEYSNGYFTLSSTESGDITYPNTDFYIQIGDTYTITNIEMPIEYIEEAQGRLRTATQEYLDSVCKLNNAFELKFDQFFLQKIFNNNKFNLDIGYLVNIVSYIHDLNDNFEIKSIQKKLNNIHNIEAKIGDVLPRSLLTRIKSIEFNNSNSFSSITNNTSSTINNYGSTFAWGVF